MKLIIKLIQRINNRDTETLTIVGTTSSDRTSDLKKLWDAEHLINDNQSGLRCHIEVVE